MSEEQTTVSVIIAAREGGGGLRRALDSVAAQTYANIVDVVVAAATDQDRTVARKRAKIVDNPTGTTPAGLNLAIAASQGDVLVRCDAQCVLPEEYVAMAVATLQRTGADNVGGMQIPIGETEWERVIASAMRSRLGAGDARYRLGGSEGPVETVYLGTFRRETVEELGGFDESFLRTQDYELNHRIVEAGGLVWFDPNLKVEYRPRGSLRALARQYLDYGRAKRQFHRKHPGGLRWRQVAPIVLVTLIGTSLILSIKWPAALCVPIAYASVLLLATLPQPRVALALGTMHFSWAAGFIAGPQ